MKILLDHNLDRRLKRHLDSFDVFTTHEVGWGDVLNGELLKLLESKGFDVLVTADSNIKNQQNLTGRSISILIIRAFDNRLATHLEMINEITETLINIKAGEIVEVFHDKMKS